MAGSLRFIARVIEGVTRTLTLDQTCWVLYALNILTTVSRVTGIDSQKIAEYGTAARDAANISANGELVCQRLATSLKVSVRHDDATEGSTPAILCCRTYFKTPSRSPSSNLWVRYFPCWEAFSAMIMRSPAAAFARGGTPSLSKRTKISNEDSRVMMLIERKENPLGMAWASARVRLAIMDRWYVANPSFSTVEAILA